MAGNGGLIDQTKSRRLPRLITYPQIALACEHLREMVQDCGAREDLAGRTLDLFVDIYAKMLHGGTSSTHSPDQIHSDYWSDDAKAIVANGKPRQPGDIQVEHGTPRRRLSEYIFKVYECGQLCKQELDQIVKKMWVVAVVTRDEHKRLKNDQFVDPHKRWADAGIRFSCLSGTTE
jgi:hypothetical protein